MTASSNSFLHATAIALAIDGDGPLAGVIVFGPPGAGKSSLALAAIEACPFRRTALVADDQVLISAGGEASAPKPLRGLLEIRGFGPAQMRAVERVRLAAAFDLGSGSERVPVSDWREIAFGVRLPLYPFRWTGAEATGAHRLRVIVRQVLCGQNAQDSQDNGKK